MARINGVDLPREKRVEIGLTYIYGIGRTTATKICVECNVNVDTRVKDLTEDEVNAIRDYIDKNQIMVEGDLRRERNQNVKRLMDIGCNRGLRRRSRDSSKTPISTAVTPSCLTWRTPLPKTRRTQRASPCIMR